ncbi:tumor protein D54-like, partial [Hyperolius riggenbachi]|uniref:tumor protein D54-like n=1 Tax=Hyperolius riggenbachi TaxID=752182 RepID=UPI0035A39D9D
TSHAVGRAAVLPLEALGGALPFSQSFSSYSIRHSISMPAMRNSATFKSFEERVVGVKPRGSTGDSEENGSQSLHSPDKSQDSAPF